jgi:hypothetical protein
MRTGTVKRATFWLGFTVVLMGVFYLFDPIGLPLPPERVTPEQDEYNCGSAAIPKTKRVSSDRRVIPEECRGPLAQHRWIGGAAIVLGAVTMQLTGFRCLITPDEPHRAVVLRDGD